jgi:hypothetical protein
MNVRLLLEPARAITATEPEHAAISQESGIVLLVSSAQVLHICVLM